jgi:hexosaminidase
MRHVRNTILLCLVTIYVARAQVNETLNLLPVPAKVEVRKGAFAITSDFSIALHTISPDTILVKAANRMYQMLSRKTGQFFQQEYITGADRSDTVALQITVKKSIVPTIGIDESYTISVTEKQIVLNAATTAGALHGLQTLLQLAVKNGDSFNFPLLTINDVPRFPWRGLMIDVSRHFIPLDVLKRNIEAMEAVKMNVLHFHLTDDQGFRIESKVFPDLHRKGSHGEYYTQAQIQELVSFAQERGIEIVPEFDMPGHSKSWFAGYPQLASAPGPYSPGQPVDFKDLKPGDIGAVMQLLATTPFPTIDPSKESTYSFLDKFIAEMSALFPSPYLHIGADENNGVAWKKNPDIAAFMQKNKIGDVHALQAYFVKRVQQLVKKNRKQMIGWEELFSEDLPIDVTVQVWQNPQYLNKALTHGNPVLVSKGFYLDIFMPAYIHYNNPDLTPEMSTQVKGGEAAQWTEAADRFNIEARIWPRAAAVAERLWSPSSVTNVDDMYRRLFVINKQLDDLGLLQVFDYERSLRLYANDKDFYALKTLADVLAPVKGYKKLFAKMSLPPANSFQTAPLTNISDIIPVDSEVKWKFRAAVQAYLTSKDAASEKIIEDFLTSWQGNDMKITDLFVNSNRLKSIHDHSKNLTMVAALGKDALAKMKSNSKPSEEWVKQSMNVLKNASVSLGETELAIISEIESLVKQQMIPLPISYSPF